MLDAKIALFLARKSIVRGSKLITSLIILILSIAFANLIFINSLLNGVSTTLNGQVIDNSTSNIVISPQEEPTRRDYIVNTNELRQEIEGLPGVVATAVHYNLIATFTYDKDGNGQYKYGSWPVVGVDPEEEPEVTKISSNIIEGNYLEGLGTDSIVLGSDIAGGYGNSGEVNSLGGIEIDEKVKVSFRNGISKNYKVVGISRVKSTLADQNAFISSKEAQSILQISDDQASQILVKIDKTGNEDWYIQRIREMAPNLKVRKWIEHASTVSSVPESFGLIAALIGAVGLMVATTTIFILIYVNTVNKRRQIGILKAIGIKENIIVISYILQAFFYVITGITLGLFLMYFVINPYFIHNPIALSIGDVSLTIDKTQVLQSIFSLLGIALLSGFIPAWRAAKENILKAIWGA